MISLKMRAVRRGIHTHVGVWSGSRPGQTRGKAGNLIFRNDEWETFREVIRSGLPGSEHPEILEIEEREE